MYMIYTMYIYKTVYRPSMTILVLKQRWLGDPPWLTRSERIHVDPKSPKNRLNQVESTSIPYEENMIWKKYEDKWQMIFMIFGQMDW